MPSRIRCDLHINGDQRKIVMACRPEETRDHLALRLSAFLFFWSYDPKTELSLKHPALAGQEFFPDLVALNEAGEIGLWVECGNVTLNKLDKLIRRYPHARLAVLKATEAEGRRLRRDLSDSVNRHGNVEIFAWPADPFRLWSQALADVVEVFGEAGPTSLNLVINDTPLVADLIPF